MTKNNILITGGAGFIGSNLAIKLVKKGYNVTVLDNLSMQIHGEDPENTSHLYNSIKNKVNFINGSVTNRKNWQTALDKQDIVVHFAAETGTGQSMYEIEKYVNTNILGTGLLLDILANEKHTIKKIIVASSRAIYGEGKYKCSEHGIVYPLARKDKDMTNGDFECKCPICNRKVELLPTDENSKIHPTSIYGITKQNQEQMIMLMGKTLKIPTVSLRYQNVYGPGQSLSNPYTGILSIFSTQIGNHEDLNIFEDGKESRDFVYIDDITDATILAIEKEEANNEIFNVGYGEITNVLNVANLLKANYNSNVKINISGNYRLGDIRHNVADINKIKNLLGYSPRYSFSKGIERFVNWVKSQPLNKSNYKKSMDEIKAKGLLK